MNILLIEPYYGGSHQQMVDLLQHEFDGDLYTLPASKWNWRMRVSALYFSQTIPRSKEYSVLFASSVLNLCELVALRPDLAALYKLYYFHENQLVYPVRKQQDRDFQHGYSQILSCLVADKVIFNSHYNMNSFLTSIQSFLSVVPDYRPKELSEEIACKCSVLYFPVNLSQEHRLFATNEEGEIFDDEDVAERSDAGTSKSCSSGHDDVVSVQLSQSEKALHILWPHRWEHDKGPEEFCSVLMKLIDDKLPFCVSILGSHTNDIPECFEKIIPLLGTRLLYKETLPQRRYWDVLNTADLVVSTAKHEFFGVAMYVWKQYVGLNNLIVHSKQAECMYNTEQQLFKRLKYFCQHPSSARDAHIGLLINSEKFLWSSLSKLYKELLDKPANV